MLYKFNDPEAPTDLRVLDQARLAALESKLSRAWVKVTAASRWTDVRVDHVFCPVNGGSESQLTLAAYD